MSSLALFESMAIVSVAWIILILASRALRRKSALNSAEHGAVPCRGYYLPEIPDKWDIDTEIGEFTIETGSQENPDNAIRDKRYPSTNCECVHYTVNLFRMTCTCPDFTDNNHSYHKQDIRRMCRHIIEAYKSSGLIDTCPAEIQSLILAGKTNKCYFNTRVMDKSIIIGWDPGNEWVTVFFPHHHEDGSRNYERYAFNIIRQQWAYSYTLDQYAQPTASILRKFFSPGN